MGEVGFGELAFWLATQRRPEPGEVRVFEAVLAALADHGFTPTAIVTRLTYLSAPDSIQGALAAGLLGGGLAVPRRHRGHAAGSCTSVLTRGRAPDRRRRLGRAGAADRDGAAGGGPVRPRPGPPRAQGRRPAHAAPDADRPRGGAVRAAPVAVRRDRPGAPAGARQDAAAERGRGVRRGAGRPRAAAAAAARVRAARPHGRADRAARRGAAPPRRERHLPVGGPAQPVGRPRPVAPERDAASDAGRGDRDARRARRCPASAPSRPGGDGEVLDRRVGRADRPAGPAVRERHVVLRACRRRRTSPGCRASGSCSTGSADLPKGTPVWFATSAGMQPGDGSMRAVAAVPEHDVVALPPGADPVLVAALGLSAVAAWMALTFRGGLVAGGAGAGAGRRRRGRAGRGPARPVRRRRAGRRRGPRRAARERALALGADVAVPLATPRPTIRRRRRAGRPDGRRRPGRPGRRPAVRCARRRGRCARCARTGGWSTWAAPPARRPRSTRRRCAAARCACSATPTTS